MIALKILAVDDEPGMRTGIERSLSKRSFNIPEADDEIQFNIELAPDGETALKMIEANSYDMLILDYKLPGVNGLEVMKNVLLKQKQILTIIMTAYASIETAIKATREGAYDFLTKPFTPEDLRYAVTKAAGRIVLAKKAKELQEEKKKVRFEFIRVLAHELKSPLSAVEGYLYLLRDKTNGENIEAYEHMVDRSILRLNQMRKLIVDLLDMTKIEAGTKERKLEKLNFKTILNDAVELFKNDALKKNVTVKLDCTQEISINADRQEIDMIFNNLISNAIKYNVDGGKVDIKVIDIPQGVGISVKDTGIGMTQDEMKILFTEFTRIRNEKTKDVLGSGLGLSILKKLVALYNGDINVKSEQGKGTQFDVSLKCKE
ncbi:MAG: response regulator receiver sensor signal transduction histidine kinase [uncultured bacterium]|nr:MAG: response regulator receiver sensor signal transduction histidine kinase [uncultured bacterium]